MISSKTKIATNLLGRKIGDEASVIDADGKEISATVVRIDSLTDELKNWIKG